MRDEEYRQIRKKSDKKNKSKIPPNQKNKMIDKKKHVD